MRTRALVTALVAVVLVATVPATVAAQDTRTGGTVVVERGETVTGDLTVAAGNLVVRGTVRGDLTALSGNVNVPGRVTGDLTAFAGNVRVTGTVGGEVSSFSGNTFVESGAQVGRLGAAGGTVVINGTVDGDAMVGAGSISLGPNAVVGGDLQYSGELSTAPGAAVQGVVVQREEVEVQPVPVVPGWLVAAYGFLVNLLLGVVLLAVLPSFSESVAGRARDSPLRSGGLGLLLLFTIPVLLVVFAITIIGIPISLLGALLFAIALWAAAVYGAYAVGAWLLSLADSGNRWLALVLGLLVVAVLARVPIVGGLIQFLILLLGLGALSLALWGRYRGRREEREPGPEVDETRSDDTGDEDPTV
jgi:cytoskeletal protein CcmA (bactofilin family)